MLQEFYAGKTFPLIAASAVKVEETGLPALITCPAFLCDVWVREIKRWNPYARVARADGSGNAARHEALQSEAQFVITGYSNWQAKKEGSYTYPELVDREWSVMVFDEAHRLRGRNSQGTQHVFRTRLVTSCNSNTPIWLASGTPILNNVGDLWPAFHLRDKRTYRSYWKFVEERAVCTETPWGRKIGGVRKTYRDQLTAELAEFSLRRTTDEIPELADLDSLPTDYFVTMPKSVQDMIKRAKEEFILEHPDMATQYLNGPGALYQLQRKIASVPPTKANPKLEWLKDFLVDHENPVVFCWYKDTARVMAEATGGFLITGDTPPSKRGAILDKWRKAGNKPLVATIASLQEGVTLTETNHVVFLEACELPAVMEQAYKRVLRRGQKKLVQIHYVWSRGTVDMAIKRTVEGREKDISEALRKWVEETEPEEELEYTDDNWF